MGYIQSIFRVSVGIKRLLFFCLIFFILCHITACLFLIIADFENSESFEGTWLETQVQANPDSGNLYTLALYWTI